MTAAELIKSNPQKEGENNKDYFLRLSNPENAYETIKKRYYQIKRKFVTTQKKYNHKGEIISTTEKLQQSDFIRPPENLELSRLSTNETTGQQWKIYTKESQNKALFELNKQVIKESVKGLKLTPIKPKINDKPKDKTLILTFTDAHIGMKIENDLYNSGKWDKKQLKKTLERITEEIYNKYDGHNEIIVEDLGDLVDHWSNKTTRGGHSLPTNLSNIETFKTAANFKVQLAVNLAQLGAKVAFYNVVNDNHGGDFCHIANLHAKEVLKYLIPDLKYIILDQFIGHYINDGIATILCHGKDKEFLKYGFGIKLDDKAKSHINAYIDRHNLHRYKIRFKKGDSHQQLFDFTQAKFDYLNYMALSPSSEWVSTNFAKGRRGFTIEEVKNNISNFTTFEL